MEVQVLPRRLPQVAVLVPDGCAVGRARRGRAGHSPNEAVPEEGPGVRGGRRAAARRGERVQAEGRQGVRGGDSYGGHGREPLQLPPAARHGAALLDRRRSASQVSHREGLQEHGHRELPLVVPQGRGGGGGRGGLHRHVQGPQEQARHGAVPRSRGAWSLLLPFLLLLLAGAPALGGEGIWRLLRHHLAHEGRAGLVPPPRARVGVAHPSRVQPHHADADEVPGGFLHVDYVGSDIG
mmetsp:Transcript_6494/g.13497  ORF Transcript_6494/g.13497 Transcript_6494/m.13497 type:complete len:238 (-) Transcript_6494:1186-1899(-)